MLELAAEAGEGAVASVAVGEGEAGEAFRAVVDGVRRIRDRLAEGSDLGDRGRIAGVGAAGLPDAAVGVDLSSYPLCSLKDR